MEARQHEHIVTYDENDSQQNSFLTLPSGLLFAHRVGTFVERGRAHHRESIVVFFPLKPSKGGVAMERLSVRTEFIFYADLTLDIPQNVGVGPHGNRQIIRVVSGKVEGPKVNGTTLPMSGDLDASPP